MGLNRVTSCFSFMRLIRWPILSGSDDGMTKNKWPYDTVKHKGPGDA